MSARRGEGRVEAVGEEWLKRALPAVAADQLSVVGTVGCRPPVAAPGQALFDHRRRRRHRLHRPIAL